MNKGWSILHVTDFHISNPSGGIELLREANFEAYISSLTKSISEVVIDVAIDAVVVTGDMVDRGAVANFPHVKKVIEHIAKQLGISSDQIYLCPGNHDVPGALEKAGDTVGARAAYVELENCYGNRNALWKTDRARLCRLSGNVLVLILDSTLGAKGENYPGTLTIEEQDGIFTQVNQLMQTDELLIVASHHPPDVDNAILATCDEEDPDWLKRHVWYRASHLHSKLDRFAKGQVLWLSGELHRDIHALSEKMHTVVTGRLGTSVIQQPDTGKPKKITQVFRQARVINMPVKGASSGIIFEYRPNGHFDQSLLGDWVPIPYTPSKNIRGRKGSAQGEDASIEYSPDKELCESAAKTDFGVSATPAIELLSSDLQQEILRVISAERLYTIGRFVTCKSKTSISWIPIGKLLAQNELLVAVIGVMAGWVKARFNGLNPDKIGLVGVDSWGAIFASQISVMTGIRNFCVAARVDGQAHTVYERIDDTVVCGLEMCDVIILVSDVIGTGRSLKFVYKHLNNAFEKKKKQNGSDSTPSRTWAIVSVICDEGSARKNNQGKSNLNFASINVTACKGLRMPILPNNSLPDEGILPPEISFLSREARTK